MIAKLAAVCIAFAGLASADAILFGLGADPNQYYAFHPEGSPPGTIDTEPAGPYPGWLGQSLPADSALFFCIDFNKVSYWGASYQGTLSIPSGQLQLEAAFLGARLVGLGDQFATIAEKGAISMAIWEITEPGRVPIDPAAQPYVDSAISAYSQGALSSSEFANSLIFTPFDPNIQSFMVAAPETRASDSTGTPEPSDVLLILTGLGLLSLTCFWRKKRHR